MSGPDRNTDPLRISVPRGHMWKGQLQHLLLLAALLPGAWCIGASALGDGTWLGLSDWAWFLVGLGVPVVQQTAVALLWRAQLCHGTLTRLFGDTGFVVWGVLFFPLLLARPLGLIALGIADLDSLAIPSPVGLGVGAVLVLPAVWTMHSVKRYFGFARALGGDHFFERYRAMPMVREGAFAYSSNAMYTFVFVGLWGIALMTRSQAALAVALFQSAYIWVHWYCVEQPDGVVLYGRSQDEG